MFQPTIHTSTIWTNARFTPGDGATHAPIIAGTIAVAGEKIQWLGPADQIDLTSWKGTLIDCNNGLITPGLIDPHTHLIWGGDRSHEFRLRQQGASYAEIAAAGGGIRATVTATRSMDEDALLAAALPRATALAREGVTTLEIKSGYGLNLDSELKMLRVARELERELPIRVRTTLLAAHTLAPEFADDSDGYIDHICKIVLPQAHAEGLVDAVDMFCETIAFSPTQCERLMQAAKAYDLPIKIHAEQLSNQQGAALAARYGALSADHLEYLDEQGITSLAEAGTVATLLPGAYYYLKEQQCPPIAALRTAGVPIALASDLNPGSSPFASLRLMMSMAAIQFGLTPSECLAAVTQNAARALGLEHETGTLTAGKRADFLLWQIDHPDQLTTSFGWQQPEQRVLAGEITHV